MHWGEETAGLVEKLDQGRVYVLFSGCFLSFPPCFISCVSPGCEDFIVGSFYRKCLLWGTAPRQCPLQQGATSTSEQLNSGQNCIASFHVSHSPSSEKSALAKAILYLLILLSWHPSCILKAGNQLNICLNCRLQLFTLDQRCPIWNAESYGSDGQAGPSRWILRTLAGCLGGGGRSRW